MPLLALADQVQFWPGWPLTAGRSKIAARTVLTV